MPHTPTPTRQALRLTWEGPLSEWSVGWPRLAERLGALRAWRPRLVLAIDVDGGAVDPQALRALAAARGAGIPVDVSPRVAGARAVTTRTAARLHEALAGALPRLDDDVGVFLWCEPAPSTLGMALSIGGAGLRALGGRAALGAVSDLATAAISARQGRRDLVELGRELRARAGQLRAAVPPPLVGLNAPLAASAVHWALGCPELDLDGSPLFGPPAAMCLAPHVAADRQTQREALLLWAARHRERSDAIVLGPATVGPTAPGEARRPRYESPRHLHEDLRDAWALGFADVTVMGGAEAVADANDGLAWLAALGAGPASSITAAAA